MKLVSQYAPTQEERSRQAFVGALKSHVNQSMQDDLEALFQERLAAEAATLDTDDRQAATSLFQNQHAYQLWGALTYQSQDLLWETVGETVDRIRNDFERRATELENAPDKVGTLELAPDLVLPKPIGDVEIHRQPGGYFFDSERAGMTAALLYMGSVELYSAAKGFAAPNGKTGSPAMGHAVAAMVKQRFPELRPARILDLGCGVGTGTLGLKQSWPDAEVHGVDISAPFVRFAHVWAEDQQTEMHYRQADAAATGYQDGTFDLVVSTILFHETWHDKVVPIMREARRLLRPGGVFLNVDVPWQPDRLSVTRRVTNHWQVRNNGEPFWSGFADTNVVSSLTEAGFDADQVFADYEAAGGAMQYFVFGGRANP